MKIIYVRTRAKTFGASPTITEVMVDDEDYVSLSKLSWNITQGGYVRYSCKFLMHHVLLPKKEGFIVDHIDRNKLNNQRSNLRYVTYSENRTNSAQSILKSLPTCIFKNDNGFIVKKQRNRIVHVSPTFSKLEDAVTWLNNFTEDELSVTVNKITKV